MRQTDSIHADNPLEKPLQWKNWIVPLLLAFLLHLFFLIYKWDWLLPSLAPSPRVEVQEMSPEQLEKIRKSWKERPILIQPENKKNKEEEAPKDARYSSNRNIHVEKEQRAQDSEAQVGSHHKPKTKPKPKAKPKTQAPSATRPKLEDLGVSYHFDQTSPKVNTPTEKSIAPENEKEGGQQALLEKSLPTGSENLLNAQESIYYSFYSRLYNAIAPIWQSKVRSVPYQSHLAPGDYSTVVDVILDADGNLIGIERLQSSGVLQLDQAVDESWRKVSRFPNPPQGLLDSKNQVHIGWVFTVDIRDGIGAQFLPPKRTY